MLPVPLRVHPGLAAAGRLPPLTGERPGLGISEWASLVVFGAGAALVCATVKLHLRIPGHVIVLSVFPMALGLALVPRYGAGLCMGGVALGTALLLERTGLGRYGTGALTSLSLTGPLLDVALAGARRGWRLYLGCCVAGLASNLVALVVRGGFKALVPESLDARPFDIWLREAAITYPLCGIIAGLMSAIVWFRFRSQRPSAPEQPA